MRIAAALILTLVAAGALAEELQDYSFHRAGWPDGTTQLVQVPALDGSSKDSTYIRSPAPGVSLNDNSLPSPWLDYDADADMGGNDWARSPREIIEYQNGDDPLTR